MKLAIAVLCAACAAYQYGGEAGRCPPGTDPLAAGDEHYCVATCTGALEQMLSVHGLEIVGLFDDGPVLRRTSIAPREPTAALCRALPHGCRCTTPACTYATQRPLDEYRVPPRCRADDPGCGPEPFGGVCASELGYHDDSVRRLIWRVDPGRHDCDYDGECMRSGWGPPCFSVRTVEPNITYVSGADPAPLQQALCGCVEHACALFEVDREVHLDR